MSLQGRFRPRVDTEVEQREGNSDASRAAALRLIDEGNAIEDDGRPDEALQRYEAAIRLAPGLARAHLNRGNILLEKGDSAGALNAYETAIDNDPAYAAAHFNMGNVYARSGRSDAAEAAYRKAIGLKPDFAEAEIALGRVLHSAGKLDAAVERYHRALAINPSSALAHSNLGNALRDLGRSNEAASAYRHALSLAPGDEAINCELGNVLMQLGQLEDAAVAYRAALQVNPDYAIAHCNLGNSLRELGLLHDAVASYRRALELHAGFAAAHYNLGNALRDLGEISEAIESYRRSVECKPDFGAALCNLANALREDGQLEESVASYHRALEIDPHSAVTLTNLGNALKDIGRVKESLAAYRRALEIDSGYVDAHYNLGTVLKESWHLAEAIKSIGKAIKLKPDFADAHNNLGTALQDLGQLDGAEAAYRRAVEIKSDFAQAHSNLLFCLSHRQILTVEALFAEHRRFGEHFEAPLRSAWPQHHNARDPARSLRVGFVSADLRNHPVAYFVEPLLKQLATSPALVLHAYHNHAVEDRVTARLRGYFRHWHRVHGLSDTALARKIGEDGIDILVDLSGHTAHNRLLTFAQKPAPLQASWIGYPGTTGLRAMDYYVSDSFLLPPGKFDDQFVEKLVQLPASAPFLPDESAPAVNALPALTNGYMTFGSFNRLSKLSTSGIELWSSLLRALPSARLLLCGMPQGGRLDDLIDAFKKAGVGRDRLRFHERCDTPKYLELHHQIDICLDTYPYTGGTTTNHALWMGVPTLTLAGPTPAGRQGAAVMGRVGLEGFVASDAADFQAKGLKWARDTAALAEIRAGLRQRCAQSVTRRPDLIAAALENAFHIMWRRWCAGEAPQTFVAEVAT